MGDYSPPAYATGHLPENHPSTSRRHSRGICARTCKPASWINVQGPGSKREGWNKAGHPARPAWRETNSPRESSRQGYPATKTSAFFLFFFVFSFSCYAFFLKTYNTRLLWRKQSWIHESSKASCSFDNIFALKILLTKKQSQVNKS